MSRATASPGSASAPSALAAGSLASTTGWADVIGQPDAVALLHAAVANPVHAYLFVGPQGSGKRSAARCFASELLAVGAPDAERARALTLAERHPDLVVIEPKGRTLLGAEAEQITPLAWRTPVEGDRKVIVVDRFHTAEPGAAASLLKTVEEPPPSVVFVLLAEDVPPEQVTIASRCVIVRFDPVPIDLVERWLQDHGADPEAARTAAEASRGDRTRARLLVSDPAVARRRQLWASVPGRLDGTGFAVASLVDELDASLAEAVVPVVAAQAAELEALAAREEQFGTRGSGRRDLEARHRREARRLREDELRFGFAVLAGVYRDQLVHDPRRSWAGAVDRIRAATDALVRNPNETLLLQGLLIALPPLH